MDFAYKIKANYIGKDGKIIPDEHFVIFDSFEEFNDYKAELDLLIDDSNRPIKSYEMEKIGINELMNIQPLELVDKCVSVKYLLRFIREGLKLI